MLFRSSCCGIYLIFGYLSVLYGEIKSVKSMNARENTVLGNLWNLLFLVLSSFSNQVFFVTVIFVTKSCRLSFCLTIIL